MADRRLAQTAPVKTFLKIIFAALFVAAAIAIWVAKIHEGREQLKRLELPDFKIEHINKPSVPWNGLAEARAAADAAFNSPEAIYDRAIKDLREILDLQKEQFEAEKKQALAKLALKKDDMTPEAYAAAQGQIESVFVAAGDKATQAEHQQEIARKQEEKANREARAAASAALSAKRKD